MVSGINSTPSPSTNNVQPPHTKPAPQQPHKSEAPQDTVQLSPAAKKAAGDADHDGDSR